MISFSLETKLTFGSGEVSRRRLFDASRETIILISRTLANRFPDEINETAASVWKLTGEPSVLTINEILASVSSPIVSVIGIGGGSVMDAAKSVAICLETGTRDVANLLDGQFPKSRSAVSLTLCPSTSGTGSEMSHGAILFDPVAKIKRGIRGRGVAADFAIVDPELSYGLPVSVTVETVFDCLTHAVETFVSRKSTEFTRHISVSVIQTVFGWLPVLLRGERIKEAREKLALASALAGVNLVHSGTCLPHRIQYAFKPEFGFSHGLGLAVIYPYWLKHTSGKHGAFEELSLALNMNSDFSSNLMGFMERCGLNEMTSTRGVVNPLCLKMEDVKGTLSDDPGYSVDTLRAILEDISRAFAKV